MLTAGPTPKALALGDWRLTLKVGVRPVRVWTWSEFQALPQTEQVVDIHCVTTWSKFDTRWRGVTLDTLLQAAGLEAPTPWVLAHSQDGYSTNVPLADLTQGRAMIATHYDDRPLAPSRGTGTPVGAASLLLEVGQVGQCAAVQRARRGRVLGTAGLSHARRPFQGRALWMRLLVNTG